MVEIQVLNKEIQKVEKIGEINKYKSDAKSIRGLIIGLIKKFRSDSKKGKIYTAHELEIIFDEVLRKFNECFPQKITRIQIIEGWEKKNGIYPIEKNFDNDFVVEIWHKENKERKIVKKADLNRMLNVVRKLEKGKIYKCYDIAKLLGYGWKTIWKERMELYFKIYYPPLKILSELGIIHYGGNQKNIVRLK